MARRYQRGFTLIELLVVIVIIAILAAILFPVFARAREKARQAHCFNNMKQIGLAMMQYVEDWDGYFPSHDDGDRFFEQFRLQVYAKSETLWICPSDNAPISANRWIKEGGRMVQRSYIWTSEVIGYNPGTAGPDGHIGEVNLTDIREPSETIAMAEKRTGVADFHLDWPQDILPPITGTDSLEKRRHNGGANFIFADGHVKWMKFSQTFFPKNLWVRDKAFWATRLPKNLKIID